MLTRLGPPWPEPSMTVGMVAAGTPAEGEMKHSGPQPPPDNPGAAVEPGVLPSYAPVPAEGMQPHSDQVSSLAPALWMSRAG